MADNLDTSQIKDWRSIVTLIVFVITNIIVLFPFHVPVLIPRSLWNALRRGLSAARVLPRRQIGYEDERDTEKWDIGSNGKLKHCVRFEFPTDFVTAPLIADLFLLAILAIGRQEVHDGTIGANNIFPLDIMVFFITLAYIAISIDASGLIRWLALKVLQKGGDKGPRLFFYLYAFFFALATCVGNDPIVLSGTPFLAYMTRVSSNIKRPRAWIFTQFAVANIASAILVSSNPTNLVLAGAFSIKFITYTANMIVPVVITAILLFPVLLFVVFRSKDEIPASVQLHERPDGLHGKPPVNPNIPYARGNTEREESRLAGGEQSNLLSLEEIMNPYLDRRSAAFGTFIMAATLITILVLNATSQSGSEIPVFWVTLPAAFVMFCWDITYGWIRRYETREIARKGRMEVERAIELDNVEQRLPRVNQSLLTQDGGRTQTNGSSSRQSMVAKLGKHSSSEPTLACDPTANSPTTEAFESRQYKREVDKRMHTYADEPKQRRTAMMSLVADGYRWSQETFPTATAVVAQLPFKLVPFTFCVFVLVQALVTKGWIAVFAHGWDHWVNRTGTVGAIGGMAFLSVVLCNFAGTNIGTTILLCRVIEAWVEIHRRNAVPVTERTFWATVYSMALGVNYGAFSTAFSASLAGLLWRDILARKHIDVRRRDFASVNLPIIALAMVIGCAVLIGEVYIVRDTIPYQPS